MITFEATNDKAVLNRVSNFAFGRDFGGDVGYVLYADGVAIGIARLAVTEEESRIESVGIVPKLRGMGFGDFFTRSLLNVLADVSDRIVIEYPSDYFLRFGFQREGDVMTARGKDIVFPRKCDCKGV